MPHRVWLSLVSGAIDWRDTGSTEVSMAHGKGNSTSGNKKRANVGTPAGGGKVKGPGMDEVVKGEMPANPDAEIEAMRSDAPTEDLSPDAAAIRRSRGES